MAFDLYANTPDADLTYRGDDPIVWDRINAERLRRGLPGLAAIGIPRPFEDADPTTADAPVSISGLPSSLSSLAGAAPGQQQALQQLSQLETRRTQLTKSVSTIEVARAANQRLLARRQEELAETLDPEREAALTREIADLQGLIDREQRQIGQSIQQLDIINSDIQSRLSSAFPGSPALAGLPIPALPALPSLPSLAELPVSLPVSPADVLKTVQATVKIPGLDTSQLTGLLGSAAKTATAAVSGVGRAIGAVGETISTATGIGKFGATPQQLEQQGLLKPGTSQAFLSAPVSVSAEDQAEADEINAAGGDTTAEQVAGNRRLNQVLSSPFSWTGKNGVSGLSGFANNDTLQGLTQQNVMSQGLDKLKSLGAVTGGETPEQLGSLVQSAAKFGPEAVSAWTKGLAPPDVTANINNVAKDAQQAVSLVNKQLPDLGAVPRNVEGKTATVDRSKLDAAFASVLGDPKISLPNFGAAAAVGGATDSALYANTPDADLTYTGDDPVVWDRINAERIRRGLPGLAAIGYPRPPDEDDATAST